MLIWWPRLKFSYSLHKKVGFAPDMFPSKLAELTWLRTTNGWTALNYRGCFVVSANGAHGPVKVKTEWEEIKLGKCDGFCIEEGRAERHAYAGMKWMIIWQLEERAGGWAWELIFCKWFLKVPVHNLIMHQASANPESKKKCRTRSPSC